MGWKTCTFSLSFKPRGLSFAPMNISSSIQVRHQRHSSVRAGARHLLLLSCSTSSGATSHSPCIPKLLLLPFLHLCLHSLADVGPDVLATQDRVDGLVFVVELGDGAFEVGNETLVFAWLCDERPRPSSGQGIHRVRREGLGWQFTSFKFGDALSQCRMLCSHSGVTFAGRTQLDFDLLVPICQLKVLSLETVVLFRNILVFSGPAVARRGKGDLSWKRGRAHDDVTVGGGGGQGVRGAPRRATHDCGDRGSEQGAQLESAGGDVGGVGRAGAGAAVAGEGREVRGEGGKGGTGGMRGGRYKWGIASVDLAKFCFGRG